MSNVTTGGFLMTPKSLDEAMRMAELISSSDMVPNDYKGKPGNVLIAAQMGAELGLKPVQALQNIAVVNGRPALWGDGMRALVMSAPDLCDMRQDFDTQTMTATCVIVRNLNGREVEFKGEFSQADAQNAGLWGRNTWKNYPKRMLAWRAFGFAARDAYADRLRGIQLAEELQDIPEKSEDRDVTPTDEPKALPVFPDDKFESQLPKWQTWIESGAGNADQVIKKASSRYQLTEQQINKIKECEIIEGEAE